MIATKSVTVRQLDAGEEGLWEAFVRQHPRGHLFQSWGWGELKRRTGWQAVRLAVLEDGDIRAAAQLLLRSRFGLSIAYVPRGPVASHENPGAYDALLDAMHKIARSRHSVYLKLEPNELRGRGLEPFLESRGFEASPQTMQYAATVMLDLSEGVEALYARMKSKTRQNMRLAEKRGVRVRPAGSAADLERFQEMMEATGAREGFPIRPLAYHRDLLEEFRERGQGELLLADLDGTVIAGLMVFAYGRGGVELYGASDGAFAKLKPNYLLRRAALDWCLERGCASYDFGGISTEAAESMEAGEEAVEDASGLWGVYEFKRRFGGAPARFAGAFDYPYIRPLYLLGLRRIRGAMANARSNS